ncbi:MAG: glycosyltransferase family 4 protein [bacterium]|nr:glycosyltransferase family 4 protein [bacterium]
MQARYAEEPCGEPRVALWFLPNFTHILRGGIRTIFSVAQDFTRTWGTTNIIAVYGKKIDLDALDTMIRDSFADLDFRVIEVADDSDPKDLPESDIAFCTLWTSAYLLVKYNKCKGKFYFAQDYEPSFYRAGTTSALIEQTYRFGFFAITNTVGVAEMVQRHSDIVGYFTPGIDHELFHANDNATKENGVSRVVFYGRPGNPRNAFNLGISALTEVKREMRDDVQIISVGAEFDSRSHGINGIIENWGVLPTMEAVTELYRSSQVGLVFMFSAHPSYQPIEFMASGCATVTNHNASNLWLLRDGYNSALVDSLVTPIADRIVRLLRDDDYRRTIVEGGLKTVSKLDWARAFADIRDFVINPINKRLPPGRSSEPFLF